MKTLLLTVVAAVALVALGVASAQQPPAENVSHKRHPNLANAQRFLEQAYSAVTAAQGDNEFDLDGHAQHAKNLIEQADRQLKAAAEWANKHEK